MKVLGDRVLIQQHIENNKTASGLYVPDAAVDKEPKGVVLAIGEGVVDSEIEVGDTVYFNMYAPTDVGDGTAIVKYMDIYAKEEK